MKRDKNLRDLSSDHHHALRLTRKINHAIRDNDNISVLIKQVREIFDNELSVHFDLEEKSILPELEKIGEHKLVKRTLDDHLKLRQLVDKLEEPGNLLMFSKILKEHVKFEEQELFEACQNKLEPEVMESIGRICNR
ncbi:MAG: hemerythrin domain-containing protein [Gammaproteobacteria bacterium]|nr:hemerythrin domain-containing protein [Gammaproteobacteria bacterium]